MVMLIYIIYNHLFTKYLNVYMFCFYFVDYYWLVRRVMIGLLYFSHAHNDMSSADLTALVRGAHARNQGIHVTGILMYHQRMFMQYLEGEEAVVRALLDRIRHDERHHDVRVAFEDFIEERLFPDWAMALVDSQRLGEEERTLCRNLIDAVPGNDVPLRLLLRDMVSDFQRIAETSP